MFDETIGVSMYLAPSLRLHTILVIDNKEENQTVHLMLVEALEYTPFH